MASDERGFGRNQTDNLSTATDTMQRVVTVRMPRGRPAGIFF